jgi:DNA-binding transcriptional LysR family regulator
MMFKQLEAIYWVAKLGGFAQAAARLHTTQSAISKRVLELEAHYSTVLFDRKERIARLTNKGAEMFLLAEKLLEQRDAAIQQFVSPEVFERHLRIGVTELTAMTWLPRLALQIQERYPKVIIEPDVDASVALRDKLLAGEIDVMIVPDAFKDERFTTRPVGTVENAWMCKPGTVKTRGAVSLQELASHRLLTQGSRSGTGRVYEEWLSRLGVAPAQMIVANNLVAIIGMTVSGLGVSHLPKKCLKTMVDDGALEIIRTTPSLPGIKYVAAYKHDADNQFIRSIVDLARQSCDFGSLFQTTSV